MNFSARLKLALSILLHGEPAKKTREIPPISPEELAEIKQFFPRPKFFILGFARSGTTILMRLISLHPEVHCNYQAHFFTRPPALKSLVSDPAVERWLSGRHNRWNHGRDLSPLVLRAAADFVMERDALQAGKRIVGDKSPTASVHGQVIRDMHALYPDAKLIYIVRDGRDVLTSERVRNFIEENRFLQYEDRKIMDRLKSDPDGFLKGEQSIFTERFIRRMAQNWDKNLAEVDQEAKRLYPDAYFPLRYEDLLTDPAGMIRNIWAFLGAETPPETTAGLQEAILSEMSQNRDEAWQIHRNEAIASFLPKGQTGNWRDRFTMQDRRLFNEIAGSRLIEWGYEPDSNW